VVYSIDQNGLSPERNLTCLRLIMPTKEVYFIFLDFPREDGLRETGIPVGKDRNGNRGIEDVSDLFCKAYTIHAWNRSVVGS